MVAFFKTDSVPYRPLFSAPRSLSSKLLALLAIFSLVSLSTYLLPSHYKPNFPSLRLPSGRQRATCSPQAWSAGQWVSKPPPTTNTNFTKPQDAYEFLGLEGCASSREHWWHLAADKPELYNRFPGVASWRWSPSDDCAVRDLDASAIVKDLVEQGGWLLIGGKCHSFEVLSCASVAVKVMVSPVPCACAGSADTYSFSSRLEGGRGGKGAQATERNCAQTGVSYTNCHPQSRSPLFLTAHAQAVDRGMCRNAQK